MSNVTGITLITHCGESIDKQRQLCDIITGWKFGSVDISGQYRGPKHPQQHVFGFGLNYWAFEEQALAALHDIDWEYPENIVLIIQPEDGPIAVYKPSISNAF